MAIIEFKKTERAHKPTYAHEGDAGADLRTPEAIYIHPGRTRFVDIEIAIALPDNCVGLIVPRSGLAKNHSISIVNTPGIIDSGYRGHIGVNLINHGTFPFHAYPGERIAQLVIVPFVQGVWFEVKDLSETSRGKGGFGSTGRL